MLRLLCWRKSAPRIGTETGASWNNHEQFQEQKCKGIILEPEQDTFEPSTVSNLTPGCRRGWSWKYWYWSSGIYHEQGARQVSRTRAGSLTVRALEGGQCWRCSWHMRTRSMLRTIEVSCAAWAGVHDQH